VPKCRKKDEASPWPGAEHRVHEGEQKITDPEQRSVQRPRVFYRREWKLIRWWSRNLEQL